MENLRKTLSENMTAENWSKLNNNCLNDIIQKKSREKEIINFGYFWSSFVMQIIVYGLLCHTLIKHIHDKPLIIVCLSCILMYLPLTIVLLNVFKRIAILKNQNANGMDVPIGSYVIEKYRLLKKFYVFRKWYEPVLLTISTGIMVWVITRLYFQGGVNDHPMLALSIFIPSIIACVIVSIKNTEKYFRQPLIKLEELIADLKSNE